MVKRNSNAGKKSGDKGNKRRKRRFFKPIWLLYLFIFGLIVLGLGYWGFQVKTQPFKDKAAGYDLSKVNDVEVVSLILDRKGRELGRIFVENRDVISIKDVPGTMIDALVAGEDQRFFDHDGVDRKGIARAAWLNFKAGRQTQGASTITQQLARNAFHLKEDADKEGWSGLERKAVEAYLAQRIEKQYSKFEILEFYLNRVPFGSGFYGIRSASLGYFGKEPRDLTLSECASLVGCIKNPTKISPLNNLEMNKKARNQVLKRMAAEDYISRSKSEELQGTGVTIDPRPIKRGASYLYERIATEVREQLGEDALTEGGFKIFTTIDLDVQKAMEERMQKQLTEAELVKGYTHPKYEDYRREDGKPMYLQGAGLMIENESGAVLAYVGGRDFIHNQFDFVQLGRKPIGTAFLPFIYVNALEKNMSPASILIDSPMNNRAIMLDGREGVLGEWGMEILNPGQYEGKITMRRALEVSKIAASVRLGKQLGLGSIMETARKFGLNFPETKLLTRMLVGSDEFSLPDLVRAYSAFPNGGRISKPMYIVSRIIDSSGDKKYETKSKPESPQIVSEQTAFVTHSMLQSALHVGTNPRGDSDRGLTNDPSLAGKTGTAHDFADNWFVGYNSQVTCAVWMGFLHGRRNAIYPGAFSRNTVFPVWIDAMNTASSSLPGQELKVPPNIVKLEICKSSGLRKTKYCQEYKRDPVSGTEKYVPTTFYEYFIKGAEPTGYCDVHGIVDDSLAHTHDFNPNADQVSLARAIPIQPKAPLLLGTDPYGTEQPDFVPRDIISSGGSTNVLNLDQLEAEDKDADIILDRPRRVIIIED